MHLILIFIMILGCAKQESFDVETGIRSEFSYQSQFISIDQHQIHYMDVGSGDPLLLIHGNPTNIYLWRNIIPALSKKHRVIAIDLIGHGKSSKEYKKNIFLINREMIKQFISKLKLKNLVIIGHDWGGALSYDYASSAPDLKGLELIEPVQPKKRLNSFLARMFWKTSFIEWYMVSQNYFVETMLPNLTARTLSEQDMANYRAPIKTEDDIRITYKWWSLLPYQSQQAELYPLLQESLSKVQESSMPKLFIVANPGVIMTKDVVASFRESFKNTSFEDIGDGKHFLPESQPRKISKAVLAWYESLSPRS